jgi:septal ring-binding cell division protein DamX
MQINEISTTIIIVISILIMTSIFSSLVFAQNDSEDSEIDLSNMTLTNSSEVQVQVGSSDIELQQQQQGPIPPAPQRQPQGPIPPAPTD